MGRRLVPLVIADTDCDVMVRELRGIADGMAPVVAEHGVVQGDREMEELLEKVGSEGRGLILFYCRGKQQYYYMLLGRAYSSCKDVLTVASRVVVLLMKIASQLKIKYTLRVTSIGDDCPPV